VADMMFWLFGALQTLLALRVMLRFFRTAGGQTIQISHAPQPDRISVILPVLNEATRIRTCLDTLITQPAELAEILAVDGGSTDETPAIVESYHTRDPRVRLINASPVDPDWTGKAWGLHVGLQHASPDSEWILCVDADVHVSPPLVRSLLAYAKQAGISAFSAATLQHLSGLLEGLIHPPLLTTLVYRFGSPGKATRDRHQVQANGQCFMARRATLLKTKAFEAARQSLCEDITIVRHLAACGEAVGFYETAGLVEVSMYGNWREAWTNWTRSLPMRDQYFGWHEALGLLEVMLVQALPLPMLILGWMFSAPPWWLALSTFLLLMRLGVLANVARAYDPRPWSYWLSPLCDLPAATKLVQSALSRRYRWRGRAYIRGKGGSYKPTASSG
jgi:dolichol-phosphate mannosyltransferase